MMYAVKNQEWVLPLTILGRRFGFHLGKGGRELEITIKEGNKLSVCADENRVLIKAPGKAGILRGVGLAVMKETEGVMNFSMEEEIQFSFNGLMLDSSRNGVVRVDYIKEMLERLAIMGHNVLMLYMEDVYEVEEEPYFGYLRGRYSSKELRLLDDYAKIFGIELIPCIQTLAHLEQFLAWDNIKEKYADIDNILCVRDEKVLGLLDRMIKSLASIFSSKRIHIGMDEAYRLGRGRYADVNGLEDKTEIMKKHLADMLALCSHYGLRPIIWDDMFFSEYSKIGDEEFRIPDGIDLMYWDYYNNQKEHYTENIHKRRKLTADTMFAGGAWRWTGFTPHHSKTYATVNASLSACKELGVKEVIAAAWGDDGSECPVSACLYGAVLFAEHGYAKEVTLETFRKRLYFLSGMSYEDYMLQEAFDIFPEFQNKATLVTPSKYMFYEDLLCSMFVCHTRTIQEDLSPYYHELAEQFNQAAAQEINSYYRTVKEFYAAFANVLQYKWNLGLNLWESYHSQDRDCLSEIAEETIPALITSLHEFGRARRREWYMTNKSNGFEALDIRIGGLIQRAFTCQILLRQYLDGDLEKIEELEEDRLDATHYREEGMGDILHFNRSLRCMTPAGMIW